MDAARDVIRLDLVKEMTGPEMLAYLYNNEKERDEVYARLRADESMKKALVYLDKSLLLAPKTRNLYQQQLFFQTGFRDLSELQKLQQRLTAAQLDLAELQRETGEYYRGVKDQENRQRYQTAIQSKSSCRLPHSSRVRARAIISRPRSVTCNRMPRFAAWWWTARRCWTQLGRVLNSVQGRRPEARSLRRCSFAPTKSWPGRIQNTGHWPNSAAAPLRHGT